MCFDDTARPPIAEGPDGAAHGEDSVLTAADGNRFVAYFARPDHPILAVRTRVSQSAA